MHVESAVSIRDCTLWLNIIARQWIRICYNLCQEQKERCFYIRKCKCKFIVKHRECLRDLPNQRLVIKCLTIIQIELEFENVGFWGEEETGKPGEKPLGARKRTNNKLNPHMMPDQGIEPGTHWWEASAFTTAPSLLPNLTVDHWM